jgi:putative FmdB family regulatory protein
MERAPSHAKIIYSRHIPSWSDGLPLYEYECEKCHSRFERIEKLSGPHLKVCPKCKGRVERLMSAPAIQFKGSGWYVTDYARSSSGGDSNKAESTAAGSESSSDSGDKTSAKDDKSKSKAAPKPKKAASEK